MPGKKDGDVVMILTTDTIIKVMETYLNEHELRRKVQVVNLQAKGDAYAFSLEYVEEADQHPIVHQWGVDITDGGWKERQVPITQQAPLTKEDAAFMSLHGQPIRAQHNEVGGHITKYSVDTTPHPRQVLHAELGLCKEQSTTTEDDDKQLHNDEPLGIRLARANRSKNGQFVKADKV
jgi:hypothetical protein